MLFDRHVSQAIPEKVWERPTYFCERCQQRYPITVRSDEVVPTSEEYEARLEHSSTVSDILDVDKRESKAKNKRRCKKPHCS